MFAWDERKRRLNLTKHGIDFHDAEMIFDGPLVTVEDTREDYGESRHVALGLLVDVVVSLTYTERGDRIVSLTYTERGDRIRIISIRKALKYETHFFFSQIGK